MVMYRLDRCRLGCPSYAKRCRCRRIVSKADTLSLSLLLFVGGPCHAAGFHIPFGSVSETRYCPRLKFGSLSHHNGSVQSINKLAPLFGTRLLRIDWVRSPWATPEVLQSELAGRVKCCHDQVEACCMVRCFHPDIPDGWFSKVKLISFPIL